MGGGKVTASEAVQHLSQVDEITFIARRFNYLKYRTVKFGKDDAEVEVPLKTLFQCLGIKADQLRHIFSSSDEPQASDPDGFAMVGCFELSEAPFRVMAKLIGKRIRVVREIPSTGEMFPLFAVEVDGRTIPALDESSASPLAPLQ